MKKILVPTDFSACATYASEAALEVAKLLQAEVHYYHFMNIPLDWASMTVDLYPDISRQVAEVQEQLNQLTQVAKAAGIEAQSVISYEASPEGIVKYASDQSVAMIIMGSHGATGLKEFFIGSNAQKVVRTAKVPVFIVKEKLDTVKVPSILFVSNFHSEMIEPFGRVLTLANLLGAKIDLLFVNTPGDFHETWEVEDKMEGFIALAGNQLRNVETINAFFFEDGVQSYCTKKQEGLLTIATHSQKKLSDLFTGGLAERVVNRVNIPVISIPIRSHSGYPRM